jgi:hypothetical protein
MVAYPGSFHDSGKSPCTQETNKGDNIRGPKFLPALEPSVSWEWAVKATRNSEGKDEYAELGTENNWNSGFWVALSFFWCQFCPGEQSSKARGGIRTGCPSNCSNDS